MSPRKSFTYFLIKALPCLAVLAAASILSSCGSQAGGTIEVLQTNGYQPNFGPFDSNGNYVEKWADRAPKRKYVSRKSKKKKKSRKPIAVPRPPQPQPQYVAAPRPRPVPTPALPKARPVAQPRPQAVAKRAPQPTPKRVAPRPTPKPKPTYVAIKPKAKPPITHAVRKGDTLYSLSRKYSTTVGSIQRANKLSGSNIRLGQRLIIPQK